MPFTIGPKVHNVVSPSLRALIEEFFSLASWEGVYLSGGTCLAEYYFGHRTSVDMDLFARDRESFREAERYLRDPNALSTGALSTIRRTPQLSQFLFHSKGGAEPIKIDLMLDLPTHLAPPVRVGRVWVDSLEDLLANKLGCLVQRSDVKDFIDLFYLIPASHLTARELVDLGREKEGGLDPLIVADQVEWIFGEPPPEPSLLGTTDWEELKLFFRKFQKECLELIRPR